MQAAAHILVRGRVQGVGFRWFVYKEAQQLELTGSVRNLPNGAVEVEVEGEKSAVERLIQRLHQGPVFAKVSDVQVEWLPGTKGYRSFTIG